MDNTHTRPRLRPAGDTDRQLADQAHADIERMLATWPAHRVKGDTDDWRNEVTRGLIAAADEPIDIERGVTRAITSYDSRFPPPIAQLVRAVAQEREARVARDANDAVVERQLARRAEQAPDREPWRAWLTQACLFLSLQRRGDTARPPEHLRPLIVAVDDLGYRPEHGIPGGPDQDASLHAAALETARQMYEARTQVSA